MLNQVSLVGVITKTEIKDGKYYIWLEVERNFKEMDGTFKTDVIKCRIWHGSDCELTNYYQQRQRVSISGALESVDGGDTIVVSYSICHLGYQTVR